MTSTRSMKRLEVDDTLYVTAMSPPEHDISAHPPITKKSLSGQDISSSLYNSNLRHDVNFDQEHQFRPNLDADEGMSMREVDRGYWQAVNQIQHCTQGTINHPITNKYLSELVPSLTICNTNPCHDVNFDRELHFHPNMDGDMEMSGEEVHKGYLQASKEHASIFNAPLPPTIPSLVIRSPPVINQNQSGLKTVITSLQDDRRSTYQFQYPEMSCRYHRTALKPMNTVPAQSSRELSSIERFLIEPISDQHIVFTVEGCAPLSVVKGCICKTIGPELEIFDNEEETGSDDNKVHIPKDSSRGS